ncbi:MAG TPA: hypothetical protein VMS17_00880 [Gemmataceae bacterium]|nr:hypothetical protein [Gemmataceae bacterium]
MHPPIPNNPNPLHVASHADRFARETHGTLNIVFSAITAISLGVMTTKLILDMVRDAQERKTHSHGRGR